MSGARLHTLLPELTSRQPVMVVGAAVIDVIADAYALPWRGCDIELKQQSVNVGGCALNIAVALKRLGIEAGNALPGWPLVCHWRMPYYWAMQWRRGLSGIGAVIVRQRARNYSSHTKTYRSLRQWLMLYSIGRCCWSSATCLITSTGILLSN